MAIISVAGTAAMAMDITDRITGPITDPTTGPITSPITAPIASPLTMAQLRCFSLGLDSVEARGGGRTQLNKSADVDTGHPRPCSICKSALSRVKKMQFSVALTCEA
jgi:hypothetical protein